MGLIKAGIGAAGGVLADSWREYFYCDSLEADVLCAKGQKRISDKGRSSNTKGESNIISDGSIIAVNEGQFMIIVEQGAIVDACGEAGEFVFDKSTEPSLFFGESGTLGDRIKKSFERVGARFSFGGDTGKDQRVYFFNAKEIVGNKYGTAQPVPFRVVDANIGLDVDISVRCNGEYSYKIVDPLMFYKNVCGNVEEPYTRDKIDSQLKSELLTALQPAFAKISAMGVRYSAVPAHTTELADALNEVLSEKWGELRGLRRGRADDQGPAEGRGHARPEHGGRQPGGFAGRRYAHSGCERERRHDGLHGHGHGKRGGRHEPAGPVRPGRQRPAKPVSRGGGRRLRGAYPRARCRSSAGCGPCCRRRCVDVLLRRLQHRQVLQQLRQPQTRAVCARRRVDLLVRCDELRQVLLQLRPAEARRRRRLGLPVRPAQHRRVLQQLRHEAPVRRLVSDARRDPVQPLARA